MAENKTFTLVSFYLEAGLDKNEITEALQDENVQHLFGMYSTMYAVTIEQAIVG